MIDARARTESPGVAVSPSALLGAACAVSLILCGCPDPSNNSTDKVHGSLDVQLTVALPGAVAIGFSGQLLQLEQGSIMTVSATTSSAVDSYAWYIDGTAAAQGPAAASITFGDTLGGGAHTLTLVVTGEGAFSSREIAFTVTARSQPTSFSFDTGGFPPEFTCAGDAAWVIDGAAYHSSPRALRSGPLENGQASTVTLSGTVPAGKTLAAISFYRKVSSEPQYDSLTFSIGGTEQGRWSGEVGWGQASYTLSIGGGMEYRFTWSYMKDSAVSIGADCAWIDDVVLTVQ